MSKIDFVLVMLGSILSVSLAFSVGDFLSHYYRFDRKGDKHDKSSS